MNFRGYTTLLSPEAMKLSYLETLLSWSRVCESISICYSRFPKMDVKVPEGAITPWEDDHSLEILEQFDRDVLGGKLNIIEHQWNPDEPREDGFTKQIARADALAQMKGDKDAWALQFDADEILKDGDELKLVQECLDDNDAKQRRPFAIAGILELFGGEDKIRFNFGNWLKIRATRNIPEIYHGMPLRLGDMAVRGRNPRTGKIIAIDNRDDGAGFITNLGYNRPDYNTGIWLFNPQVLNMMGQVRGIPQEQKAQAYSQITQALLQDIGSGSVWMYHTGWVDIARKYRMGWFFDNFWSVLSGKQDTFIDKAEFSGEFTATRCPSPEELPAQLAKEMDRVEIQSLGTFIDRPSAFETVANWRSKNNL